MLQVIRRTHVVLMIAGCGSTVTPPVDDAGVGSANARADAALSEDATVAKDAASAIDASSLAEDATSDASDVDGGVCARPCSSDGDCAGYGDPCLACDPDDNCCDWEYVSCAKPLGHDLGALPRAQ
jgi:hypothetical protein